LISAPNIALSDRIFRAKPVFCWLPAGSPSLFRQTTQFEKSWTLVPQLENEVQVDRTQALMRFAVVQFGARDSHAACVTFDEAAKINSGAGILDQRGRAHVLISQENYEQMYQVDPQSLVESGSRGRPHRMKAHRAPVAA